jgi:outer membrane protein assembly factor BamA
MRRRIQLSFLCCIIHIVVGVAQQSYPLRYHLSGKDTLINLQSLGFKAVFSSENDRIFHMETMLKQQRNIGYVSFSVDSLKIDSVFADVWLFIGDQYKWKKMAINENDLPFFDQMGWNKQLFEGKWVNFEKLDDFKNQGIKYLENNGYPFAKLQLDSIKMQAGVVEGKWILDKGPQYKLDSITVSGNATISKYFLYQYLDLPPGGYYKKDKLDNISKRLAELPFLKETQKWDITLLGTGATVNLYLDNKPSSQFNALVGLLPNNNQLGGKPLITGEANIKLNNSMGGGETLGLNWQQLQVQSPRLNILYQQPYILQSKIGLDCSFNLLKKDSSFINLHWQAGIQYMVSSKQSGRIFFQGTNTNLLNVDTNFIKSTRKLPVFLDVGSKNIGVDYQLQATNYRLNPRSGNEVYIMASAGIRNLRKNNTITSLSRDYNGNVFDFKKLYDTLTPKSYILKLQFQGIHYFPIGKQATLKSSVQAGIIQTENVFKNEIFQFGGYKMMRGFNEESIYASQYALGSVEYRYLIGLNAYIYSFFDGAFTKNNSFGTNDTNIFIGTGIGLSLETKAGILNLSYALGKSNEEPFSLRQSKIHFGFVSIF